MIVRRNREMSDDSKLRAYLFTVEIDGIETARFQKCEGLEAETYVYEVEEGGLNHTTRKFRGRTRFPNLILEKGITENDSLFNWFKETCLENKKLERKNGSVVLKDTEGNEVKRWNFFRIKKIFGETELKEFADYAFDSTGSYWKVNEAGDLADDGKTSRVADAKGSEIHSGTKGLQGTLQEWLGMENAYAALMQPAGFEWDGKKWSKNPGKIDHSVIEKAHNDGHLTDDQYNLIQLAAGKSASDDKSEKINLFKQFFSDYKQANIIKTQVQVDIANRAWEWLQIQRKKIFGKNVKYSNDVVKAPETNQGTICLKQQPLEKKYGYPYTAPSFGSLCLATSIINLYILNEGLTEENVENFMNDAKGKFIASDGNVISFEKMSKKLSELSGTSQYFDYIYYNPETKTYSVNKKAMTKDDFIKSDYDYGIGAYIHLYDDPEDPDINIAHYELIKRNPFIEYNPGISDYKLYEIYPVKKYNRG